MGHWPCLFVFRQPGIAGTVKDGLKKLVTQAPAEFMTFPAVAAVSGVELNRPLPRLLLRFKSDGVLVCLSTWYHIPATVAGGDVAEYHRNVLRCLDGTHIELPAHNTALFIIDPQHSFTTGRWKQSIISTKRSGPLNRNEKIIFKKNVPGKFFSN